MPVATVALPTRPLARITPYEAEKKARDRHPRPSVQARSGPEGPRADTLVAASKARDVTLLRKFIAAGANVNGSDRTGNTALIWAAINGDEVIARELLLAGASPTITGAALTLTGAETFRLAWHTKQPTKFNRLLQTSRGALLACRFLATVRVVHGLFAWRHRAMERLYALGLLGFLQTRCSAFAAAAGTNDKQAARVTASDIPFARSASGAYDDEMEAFLSNAETLLFGASIPFARSATLPPLPHRFSLGNSSEDDHSQREPSLKDTQRASSSLPLLHASL